MTLTELVNRIKNNNIVLHPLVAIIIILVLLLIVAWIANGIVHNITEVATWLEL